MYAKEVLKVRKMMELKTYYFIPNPAGFELQVSRLLLQEDRPADEAGVSKELQRRLTNRKPCHSAWDH